MKQLTPAVSNHILFLLDSGNSCQQISHRTGVSKSTISSLGSRYRPYLKKAAGGCPSKLSDSNICYALCLIGSGEAENAVQVTKSLQKIIDEPLCAQTVRNGLKKVGMMAVVKRKRPLLVKKHMRERLDFAIAHKDWTLDDWKRVVWSDETKNQSLGVRWEEMGVEEARGGYK